MGVVIEIGASGNDPIDKACFDQRNQRGNAESGRRQRPCQRKTDSDVRLQHFLCKELACLAQPRGIVGEKSLVNQIRNSYVFLDWGRIDSLAPQEFAFVFTHVFIC